MSNEIESIVAIPAMLQGFMDGMHEATKQKWRENTIAFFSRAIMNRAVSIECKEAEFSASAKHFEDKAVYFIAQGLYCLARSAQ